ncbi:MAG: GTP-binding protein [Deltaproteobacteria bacterium]|nr:GTP-binding protein [Deltaproteobacteria bacterium]
MGAKTHVYLITGFLGAGKTTFLNRIIKSFPPDKKLMILMNEFGEVGVDGTLVEGEDLTMMEISKGSIFCVCVKTDFIKGLNEIAATVQPDILLIESTGVANPTDLKRDLKLPFFKDRFDLDEQFCIVDAHNFAEEYEIFASVEKQIASSTMFIINKVDQATPEEIAAVKELVAENHPNPRFYETSYGEVPLNELFPAVFATAADDGPLPEYLSPEELETAIEDLLDDPNREITPPDRLLSAVYQWSGESLPHFQEFLERLPRGVIRAKGFFAADGATHLYSQVMATKEVKPATLPAGRQALLNMLVVIAPPEVMNQLEEAVADFPYATQHSVLDPMAGQE